MEEDKEIEVTLSPKDSGWTDYVLTLFEEDEKFRGLPKFEGLRRVSEIIVGEIIGATKISSDLFIDNKGNVYATVGYEYTFKDKNNENRVFGDVADVTVINVEDPTFAKFATALASTRAKSRALREALKIKVVTYDEMGSREDAIAYAEKKFMTENQIRALGVFCKRNDVNLWLYVNSGKVKNYTSLAQVPYDTALTMMKKIDEWQRDNSKIPEKFKGFDPDWKKSNE